MKPLTPTATAVLQALADGPATAAALRTRLGCGRSTLDKTLADLARTHLATRLPDDHPDHPGQWTLAPDPDHDTTPPPARDGDAHADADTDVGSDAGGEPDEALAEPVDDDPDAVPDSPQETTTSADDLADDLADAEHPAQDEPGTDGENHAQPQPAQADEVKLCRGCQAQMPKICPTCRGKTTSYCGSCRQAMPTRGRGTGTAEILSNGLPKLARGQLAELVHEVMRTHPLPDHLGITGWTSGRIAVYLPGRSSGAIGNVLDKLATTGTAELLADNPKRYRLRTQPDTAMPTDHPAADAPTPDAAPQ